MEMWRFEGPTTELQDWNHPLKLVSFELLLLDAMLQLYIESTIHKIFTILSFQTEDILINLGSGLRVT